MSNIGYMKYDTYKDICNAVREKTKEDNLYLASELPEKIRNIKSGGGFDFISESRDYNFTNDNPHPTVNITTQNNEAYFIYDNRDRKAWFGFNILSSGTTVVEKGHLDNNGNYIQDDIINPALASNTVFGQEINLDYDYAVIKISGLIKYWNLQGITINGFKSQANLQKILEVIADVPHFEGANASSSTYKISVFTRKFIFKNAAPKITNYLCNGGWSLEEFIPINVDWNTNAIFDNSKLTYSQGFFYNCFRIKEIDLSGWNIEKFTNFAYWFYKCQSLERVNFDNVKSQVLTIEGLFQHCYNLKELDLSPLDTSLCTRINSVFEMCQNLSELDLSNNTFGKLTTAANTFNYCFSLKSLKLPILDLSVCGNMSYTFSRCYSLIFDDDLTDKINNWNITNKCVNFNNTFYCCYSLRELDLRGWNLSSITIFQGMFFNCYSLLDVKFPVCEIPKTTNFCQMFYNCWSLREIDLSVLTVSSNIINCDAMFVNNSSNKSIKLPLNVKPTTLYNSFNGCTSLKNLINFETWDTSNAISFNSVFNGCFCLRNIDISNIKLTNKCTTLANMFCNCYSLEEIVFPTDEQDGSNIKSINGTIQNCYNLKRFECKIDMPLVNNAQYFGENCQQLKYIDTSISLDKITSYPPTYSNCVSLEYANYSSQPTIAYNLSTAPNLSREYLLDVINKLPTLSAAKTLTLGQHRLKLTNAELKIATDKKWTIA